MITLCSIAALQLIWGMSCLKGLNKNWLRVILLVLIILVLLPHMRNLTVESIVNYAPASMPLAVLVFIMLYVLKSIVIVVPVSMFYIAAGIVFPVGWALVVTYFCLVVALSLGYMVGKYLGEDKVNKIISKNKKLAAFLSEDKRDNLSSFCFIARVIPVPFDLLSMFCGALNMPYWRYIYLSLLGLSPVVIPFVISGASVSNPMSAEFIVPFSFSIVVTLAGFILFKQLNKKRHYPRQ